MTRWITNRSDAVKCITVVPDAYIIEETLHIERERKRKRQEELPLPISFPQADEHNDVRQKPETEPEHKNERVIIIDI